MGRIAPIRTARPVPTGLMVLAGILCHFALPFALILAHFANRHEINGWRATIAGGAGFGAMAGILLGGPEPQLMGLSVALGTAYGLSFCALAHGMAHLRDRKARS
ncbi:hypothetical protein K3728_13630 [Rhodobacteraceae bacterium M385]|nr:hypothetical protein K3728_13630 [Rhodobacteraceae bacterium M385]